MARAEWGIKRICLKCAARYYDMKKTAPECPKCGTVFDPESMVRSRRGARLSPAEEARRAVAAAAVPEPETEEDIETAGGEGAPSAPENLIEDASELGEEDVDDVVEREEDEES